MKTTALYLLLAALPALAQQSGGFTLPGTVTAKIEPTSTNMNHGAIITIRIVQQSEKGAPPKITVATPKVEGLSIRPDATNWYHNFTDSIYKNTTQQTFSVRPLAPGDYTIPAFDVSEPNGGRTYHVPALTFKVTP